MKVWTDILTGETKEIDVNEPRMTRSKAGKGLKVITLKNANDGIHKFKALIGDQKIYFGAFGMSDMTKHKNEDRKNRYILRHKKREDWNDLTKAGTYSRYILWNKPSLEESIEDMAKRFNVKIKYGDTVYG